jgi:hypothetical protein
MLADAKRAHDFVRWVLGPPSAPQVQPVGGAMQRGGLQPVAGMPRNVVATSVAAPPPSAAAAPEAGEANAEPPGPTDHQPNLGAAYGNPNIERQGAEGRKIAAMRPAPHPAITDFFSSIPLGIARAIATTTSAGGQAAQIEMQQPVTGPSPAEALDIIEQNVTGPLPRPQGPGGQFGETLGEFLGNPVSYIGSGSIGAKLRGIIGAALASEAAGQATKNTWAEPFARFGAAMGGGLVGSALRGSSAAEAAAANAGGRSVATRAAPPRSPTASVESPPYVDTATAPLMPISPWDRALAAARPRGDIDWDALSARARQFHGALDSKAQTHRTTAVLSTDGPTIIGGSGDDFTKWQRFLLRDGEVYAEYPGAHAEETVLSKAIALGYRPRALVTTWRICDKRCEKFVTSMGGVISPDRRMAIFPP